MRQSNSPKVRIGLGFAIVLSIVALSSLRVQGASSIAQGFKTSDPNVVSGALVSLTNGRADTVELATVDNVSQLLGVAGQDSLIELSSGTGAVQIVTTGVAQALVSDINGTVKTGDRITASPISGVGMKAVESTTVIGIAQADLSSVSTQARTVTQKNGQKQTVHIGLIPIQVDKTFYQAPQSVATTFVPPALQDFASNVVGHQVSPVRVMIAGLLSILLFVVITILLYSAVHSSIISIGRNPLSETAVRRSLIEVGLAVAGVLVFTVAVIYLILTT